MPILNTPFQLPCGATLANRIAKSAMSENLGNKDRSPSNTLIKAYERWGRGGAGLLITGNVMLDAHALGEPRNVVVENELHLPLLRQWAKSVASTGTQLWVQINHPGRQALGLINAEVVAPSAVRLKKAGKVFKMPRALTQAEIWDIIERFGNTAQILKKAGFSGVQIHGAHGYLVSQFLSPLSNVRTDEWGGSLQNRARFAIEVYRNIRSKVGPGYPVGIKINSADFQRGGFGEEESMQVVGLLAAEGIDLIEISGGTYEKAAMMGASMKKSTAEREAYFMEYVEKVRKLTDKPLMLTGGFRTKKVMEQAVEAGKLDIVGLARPFTVYPDLARELLGGIRSEFWVPNPKTGIKAVDNMGFLELVWHELQIKRLGQGKAPDPELSPYKVVLQSALHNLAG